MKTYIEMAENKENHEDFLKISKAEDIPLETLITEVANGHLVIVPNRFGNQPLALGKVVRSKVLCNMGTSSKSLDIDIEIQKAKIAIQRGASIICDQSVGDNVYNNRKKLSNTIKVPLASIPLYQNVDDAKSKLNDPLLFTEEQVLKVLEDQIKDGITMPGIHSMTFDIVKMLNNSKRLMPVVSRGGGIMLEWIKKHNTENPYFKNFDIILDIMRKYNVPLTFVSSLRAGTVVDGYDECQEYEWQMLRKYIKKAHDKKVSVIVDGFGHMSIDQIPKAVQKCKELCYGVPLGALGPASTDRGLGHEHIVNAIGTAVAVQSGVNYCNACYKTEHLGLPEIQDIAEGISSSVVATYTGDLARKETKERLLKEEKKMSIARKNNQWGIQLHNAIDKAEAMETFNRVGKNNKDGKGCSICGNLCPFVVTKQVDSKQVETVR